MPTARAKTTSRRAKSSRLITQRQLNSWKKKANWFITHYWWQCIMAVTLLIILSYAANLICSLLGVLFPAYMSVSAIQTNNLDQLTRWLSYWVVYAAFSSTTSFSDFVMQYFPFYWIIKIAFITWCLLPINGNGTQLIYSGIILPIFDQYRERIDRTTCKMLLSIQNVINQLGSDGTAGLTTPLGGDILAIQAGGHGVANYSDTEEDDDEMDSQDADGSEANMDDTILMPPPVPADDQRPPSRSGSGLRLRSRSVSTASVR